MGGRLWPLLALLGTAVAVDLCAWMNPCANGGTCSMVGPAWICRCPGRWRGKRCQAGPAPPGPLSTSSSGRAKPSPGSWDPGPTARPPPWHLSRATSGAVEMPSASTAAERTSEAGSREWAEYGTLLGRDGQSPTATTAATWLSRPTSPADATALGSSPSFFVEGVTTTSPPQWSGAVAGPEAAVLPSLHPASSPRMQWEGARPTHPHLPGPSLAAGAALPGPTWSSAQPPLEDAAALAELAHRGHAVPQTGAPEEFLRQAASSSQGYEELGRQLGLHTMSPQSAVGILLPSTAPPASRAPPGSILELDLLEGEEVTPGGFVGTVAPATSHKVPLQQRTPGQEWEGPSSGVSRAAARGSETTPHVTPSSPYAAAASARSPDFLPSHTGRAPNASQSAPSPSSALSHGGLSTGPTEETGPLGTGQDARWNPAALQTPTGPLTVPRMEPLQPQGAPNAPATRQSPEPFSPLPSPGPLQHLPSWVMEGGTSSKPASSSSRTSAAGTDKAGLSSDSPGIPLTDTPPDSSPHQAASSQASPPVGESTATAALPGHFSSTGGQPATWMAPHPAESQASSAAAAKADSALVGPSWPPLRTALLSSAASAVTVSTSQAHDMEALSQFSVAHQAWSPPARTWSWSRADRSTERPGREAPPSPPLPTAKTTWHTWPPARGDLPVASTWLLAVVPEAATQPAPAMPREVHPRVQHVFVAENQPPALKAAFLHLPWELVLAMESSRGLGSPRSPEHQDLMLSINGTVAPLFAPLPGFQRLEVKSIRPGGVVVLLDAIFQAQAPGWRAALSPSGPQKQPLPRLWAANTSIAIRSLAPERPLDLCAEIFSCPAGYDCVVGEDRNATCASVCHQQYCKNQGICTHAANQTPVCQCPVGSDFWFLGVRCDYRVTQQGLLGVAGGLLLSLLLIGAAIFALVVRRVRLLLLEARADQTKSSYRRFCRLDDVSAHYWSAPWMASVSSLDNPAFSNSEELLHLQALEPARCNCREGCLAADGHRKPLQGAPCRGGAGQPRSLCSWERSSASGNEHMVDSGKASEVSVCSWPLEPIQWSPSPARHERARQSTHKSRRPHSYCEGMELVSLERSWTA